MVVRPNWLLPVVPSAVPRLVLGIICFGVGIGAMAQADLGLGPWSVMHQGIGRRTGVPLGTVDILLSIPVVFAFFPLRQRPGLGTLLSATLLGFSTNVAVSLFPAPNQLLLQIGLMVLGVTTIGLGSAMYLTSGMGPGPRDGIGLGADNL